MSEALETDKKTSTIGPKEILLRYLPFLPWIMLSLAISGALAWLNLRYATPIYSVAGKLLVKQDNPYGNQGEKFGSILSMPGDNSNLLNEIEIIKSRAIAARVVRKLGLQLQYANKGQVLTSEAYSKDIPFNWAIEHISDSTLGVNFELTLLGNNQFSIKEGGTPFNFGQLVKTKGIDFRIFPNGKIDVSNGRPVFVLSWLPVETLSATLSGALTVNQLEGASVLNLTFKTPNKKNGLDIVNSFMKEYQQASLEDNKLVAFNTLQFIDNQLDTLKKELGGVEKNLQRFREDNRIFNPELQATQTFSELSESQKQLLTKGVQIKVLDYMRQYMGDPRNQNKLVPSNLGIEEPSLVQQISTFNELQLKRETSLKTTTEANPLIVNYTVAIEKVRQVMIQNLTNVRNAYLLSNRDLESVNNSALSNIKSMPGKEKQLLEVTRRQAILQELYSFLLQKKLETAISSASTISDIKILEPAIASSNPVSPNRRSVYTIAMLIGLALPMSLIFLIDFLNDKVSGRHDIEKMTDAPILGEVGHADDTTALIVTENNRTYIAEQFRIIRSNLQYVLPKNEKPVILVTSSFSGEGKSFISTNLGAVLALSGKKTVILEMDIRKPKILKGLGMHERKGITNYLVADFNVEEIIHQVPGVDNMYVIPCGPVPPNPAEMLLDDKMVDLFALLRKKFDAIIIDSAPVGLVSDAMTLSEHANATVFIVRHYYTYKKQIELIDELYVNNKLPHLSIAINDIQTRGGYGSYYGYGYGYGDRANVYYQGMNKRNWIQRIIIAIIGKMNK
jgi:tyrosine-protein kinase Etk/Wzc